MPLQIYLNSHPFLITNVPVAPTQLGQALRFFGVNIPKGQITVTGFIGLDTAIRSIDFARLFAQNHPPLTDE